VFLIALPIVAFPLLKPRGPGHFTPVDVLIAAAILGVLLWAGTYRLRLRLPYVIPMSILLTAGALAALFSQNRDAGALALLQDVFIFAWAAAIANVVRVPRNLSIILAAWAWAATFWASMLILGALTNQSWIVGATHAASARGQLWFDNPNMAGVYFVMSLFVVFLGRHPRNRVLRAFGVLLMLSALVITGSNGAILALILGAVVSLVVTVRRRTDAMVALVTGMIALILIGGLAYLAGDGDVLTRIEGSPNGLIQRSVARGPNSAEGRATLYAEEFELYRSDNLLGIGPANTKASLKRSFAVSVEEAHDDYLAALVERGVVGALGLLLLIASVAVMAYSVVRRPLSQAFADRLGNSSAIAGAVAAMAVYAMTHELLHYRHVWALLGILAGIYLFGRETPAEVGVLSGSPSVGGDLAPA
jgi:O-antigen ligase